MKELAKDILLGVAVADALGAPVEFKNSSEIEIEDIKSNFANNKNRTIGFGTWTKPVGTYTDDTSMTLCTAEYLLHAQNYTTDFNLLMQYFVDWITYGKWTADGECFDIGGTVNLAIGNFINESDWTTSGLKDMQSNGNGSLMRILPALLPLLAKDDAGEFNSDLRSIANRDQFISNLSSITHGHSIAVSACRLYLLFASYLIAEKNALAAYTCFVNEKSDPYSLIPTFERLFSENFYHCDPSSFNAKGYVLGTLEIAIHSLITTNSYQEAVVNAITLGGDTDTNAAVTGGLAGILYGHESIPKHWIEPLKQRAKIEKLADQLGAKFNVK